jgi:mono/diheme cytochrome c family protein
MLRVSFGTLWLALAACHDPDRGLPPAYRELEVPVERLASTAARARGRETFLESCALCHGAAADGHGARRDSLSAPPQDFTKPEWRHRVTPRGVYFAIREGKRGTSMASWKALTAADTWDLVAYLLSISEPAEAP